MVDPQQHWESIYRSKATDEVSWFQSHAGSSLRLIHDTGAGLDARIIDVGGGASVLVDNLLDTGYRDLTVLDLSESALAETRKRLGARASQVSWLASDITQASLPANAYDVWHDRAVFHFLTDPADRVRYVQQVLHAVKPGGHVIVATFGPGGPLQCSGLDVVRYAPDTLHAEFGAAFRLLRHETEVHQTPTGREQEFVYCYCVRT